MQFPPPLTREEEQAAFEKILQGDKDARDRVILSAMPYVIKMVSNTRAFHCERDELIGASAELVCELIDKFDPTRGVRFLTFVGKCMTHHHMKMGVKAAKEAARRVDDPLDLQAAGYAEEMYEEQLCFSSDVVVSMTDLSIREQYIVIRVFGLFGNSVKRIHEIADFLEISRATVHDIYLEAIAKLKRHLA